MTRVALLLVLAACEPPVSHEPSETELRAFARAAQSAGTELRVIRLDDAPRRSTYVVRVGDDELELPSVEVVADVVAPDDVAGPRIQLRVADGSCGTLRSGRTACIARSFRDAGELHQGHLWAVALAGHGPPNEGAWSILAGSSLPDGVDPAAALSALERGVGGGD